MDEKVFKINIYYNYKVNGSLSEAVKNNNKNHRKTMSPNFILET